MRIGLLNDWVVQKYSFFLLFCSKKGSGALYHKMLLVGIIENNKIYLNFQSGQVKQRLTLPRRVWKGIKKGPAGLELEKKPKLCLNNPRSSVLPLSALYPKNMDFYV